MSRREAARRLTRREFLGSVVAAAALAALPSGSAAATVPKSGQRERIKTLLADVKEETAADFGRGAARGVAVVDGGATALLRGVGGAEFVSGTIALPFPATHVGLHWLITPGSSEDVQAALRTRVSGEAWSEWCELDIEAVAARPDGREVFACLAGADRADAVQYRLSFPSVESEVQVVTVTAINTLDGPPEVVPTAIGETATVTTPSGRTIAVVTREGWGCEDELVDRDGLWPEMYVPVKKVVVHHTATTNSYSADEAAAQVRAVWNYHAITLGWGDIGYNALIDKYGAIYEGRHARGEGDSREILGVDVVAGHCYYHNYGSTGVSAIGNYQTTAPTPELLAALEHFVAFECDRHCIDPAGADDFLRSDDVWHDSMNNISGHYESYSTSCPGRRLKAHLPTLREDVASSLNWTAAASLSELDDKPRELQVGDTVSFDYAGATLFCMEGWYKPPDAEPIEYLAGSLPGPAVYADELAWTQSWSTGWMNPYTFASPGHYTMHVRLADYGAAEANLTYLVKPATPPAGNRTVYVADLSYSASAKGKSGLWQATVTATVLDTEGQPVAGATVEGHWGAPVDATASGITGDDGTVTLSSGTISSGDSVTFTVADVTGADLKYDPTMDGAETSVTVYKP